FPRDGKTAGGLTTPGRERMIRVGEHSMNRTLARASVLIAFCGLPVFAQSVISAHSGLINYVEGRALLDDKAVEVKISAFPEIKDNMEFRTEDGRAEVLLNP